MITLDDKKTPSKHIRISIHISFPLNSWSEKLWLEAAYRVFQDNCIFLVKMSKKIIIYCKFFSILCHIFFCNWHLKNLREIIFSFSVKFIWSLTLLRNDGIIIAPWIFIMQCQGSTIRRLVSQIKHNEIISFMRGNEVTMLESAITSVTTIQLRLLEHMLNNKYRHSCTVLRISYYMSHIIYAQTLISITTNVSILSIIWNI